MADSRAQDGKLSQVGFYPSGGSGSFEDSSNALVLTNGTGEIAPTNLVEAGSEPQFLLAANAGRNSITVFRVTAGRSRMRGATTAIARWS